MSRKKSQKCRLKKGCKIKIYEIYFVVMFIGVSCFNLINTILALLN